MIVQKPIQIQKVLMIWNDYIKNITNGPLLIILVLGLGLRVIGLVLADHLGIRIVDERHYFQLASSIFTGWGFAWGPEVPTSIRPPFYPAFLASIWTLVGHKSLFMVRVAQILINLLTVCLVYQLGCQVFSKRTGLLASAIFCLYPSFLAFNYLILTEVLFTFFLVAFLLGYVLTLKSERLSYSLGTGMILGVAALTRSILWPFPIILAPLTFFFLKGEKQRRVLLVGTMVLGYLLVITPWAIRNTELQKVFTVVNSMGGITLMMGNYEHTPLNRAWDPVSIAGDKSIWVQLKRDFPDSGKWTEGQKEKWAQKEAFRFMMDHPALTLKRIIVKFASFWGLERTIIGGIKRYFHPPPWLALTIMIIIPVSYAFVMVFACLGLFLAHPKDQRFHVLFLVIILFMSGLHALVFGHPRYHLPLIPVLILYGASAISERSWFNIRKSLKIAAGPITAYGLLLMAWGREVLLVESERVRLFLNNILGS